MVSQSFDEFNDETDNIGEIIQSHCDDTFVHKMQTSKIDPHTSSISSVNRLHKPNKYDACSKKRDMTHLLDTDIILTKYSCSLINQLFSYFSLHQDRYVSYP